MTTTNDPNDPGPVPPPHRVEVHELPPTERPQCSEDCTEPASARFSHGEPGSDAVFYCAEHAVIAIRRSVAQRLLLDIVTHPAP